MVAIIYIQAGIFLKHLLKHMSKDTFNAYAYDARFQLSIS